MNDADLSPPGPATLIAELVERLGLDEVTLVGNDTGGALCQLVLASPAGRTQALVLTSCDAFEHFPPSAFTLLVKGLARVAGALAALAALERSEPMRRGAYSPVPLTLEPLPDALLEQWMEPRRARAIRRDAPKVMRGTSPERTVHAVRQFAQFERPVLVAWGTRDPFFPPREPERHAASFPDAASSSTRARSSSTTSPSGSPSCRRSDARARRRGEEGDLTMPAYFGSATCSPGRLSRGFSFCRTTRERALALSASLPTFSRFTAGPEAGAEGPVLVSLTEFHIRRRREPPGIVRAGRRLRAGWHGLPGAVGLWLWADLIGAREGSLSTGVSEDDLRRFVSLPAHGEIMSRYRARGSLRPVKRTSQRFGRAEILAEAKRRLDGGKLSST